MNPSRKKKPAPKVLDVREDLQRGRDPFHRIMETVDGLAPGQGLHLIAPFQPLPLLEVMRGRGFAHQMQPRADGGWDVLFQPDPYAGAAEQEPRARSRSGSTCAAASAGQSAKVVQVDTRGLPPPEPLERVLQALSSLPDGVELEALTDRSPVHLLPLVEQRGFTTRVEEQSDGSYVVRIRRR